uniref:SagB/ThcOx family dehydrogenase n=1 Tax=Crenothrix polyspora TaxID=360316 RepID=UPI0015C62F54
MMNKPTETVLHYHHRTKHRLERYAKGPESIDWEDQPDSFRRFSGCKIVNLPKPGAELKPLFAELDSPETIPSEALNLTTVGLLLELSFGLSAWKEYGSSRWALRCNPSSGNLHPTEAYLIATSNDFIESGVYHYVSHDHSLEQRCHFSDNHPDSGILIGLSSIHWREAWKYGERAYRYCQHDTGHALGALRYAAATLGWSVELLAECSDEDIANLLGLNRNNDFKPLENESPDLLCRINACINNNPLDTKTLIETAQSGSWFGKADSLRAYHLYKWPIIDEVATAASKPHTEEPEWQGVRRPPRMAEVSHSVGNRCDQQRLNSTCTKTATTLIRQRRSAQQFDGKMSALPMTDFYRMLAGVLPTTAAFELWRWPAQIHLFIFVHRIEGLAPGLYALPRTYEAVAPLRAATLVDFDWQKVAEAIPLYHLYSGNCRQQAKTLSCHQSIASDGAFSLAMVAEFSETIGSAPWLYRRLF